MWNLDMDSFQMKELQFPDRLDIKEMKKHTSKLWTLKISIGLIVFILELTEIISYHLNFKSMQVLGLVIATKFTIQ